MKKQTNVLIKPPKKGVENYKEKRIEAAEHVRSIWEVPCRSMEQLRLRTDHTLSHCLKWNLNPDVAFYSNHRFQTLLLLEEI